MHGTIRRIIEELAGCINKHDAKTGSKRARRSAPARLVYITPKCSSDDLSNKYGFVMYIFINYSKDSALGI
jgi:hypothetical protein